ncbi:MAG: DegT/DnrJ/EryC1/StrS family aminotransferase [Patescibacteria group bacterium]|nr:DegT/DnrJ/EryC1/StrS family aminotransferase [Patescibacteria group bacterium]
MQKPIFNSLGSNYSWSFAWQAVREWFGSHRQPDHDLGEQLVDKFGGQAFLTYKGRDAIWLALKALGVGRGDQVLTQAFTCHAVEEAITRVGAEPIFVDLAPGKLNPSVVELERGLKSAKKAKLVLMQHTLGVPAKIDDIVKWCGDHNLLVLEDLAQAIGGVDESGQTLGSLADAVVLSFGRDKMVDAVSGGAVVVRSAEAIKTAKTLYDQLGSVPRSNLKTDLWYPSLTNLIRATHPVLIGQVILKVCRQQGWLKSPVWSPLKRATQLPLELARLVLCQWHNLVDQVTHRHQIARVYQEQLVEISLHSSDDIERGSNQRFSIKVAEPDSLVDWLKQHKIYVADRWYRSPVDSGNLGYATSYRAGSCPQAELLANQIVNLPTHQGIKLADADRIARLVIQFTAK